MFTRPLPGHISEAYRINVERNLQHHSLSVWPRALRAELAASYLGMSRSRFDAAVRDGNLPKPFPTVGTLMVWDKNDLDDWLDDQRARTHAPEINEWDDPSDEKP